MKDISIIQVAKTFYQAGWSPDAIQKIISVNPKSKKSLIDLLYYEFKDEPYTPNKGILDHWIIRRLNELN